MSRPDQPLVLLTGTSNPNLAKNIGTALGQPVHVSAKRFPDGEVDGRIPVNVRNADVFIVQSTGPFFGSSPEQNLTVNDSLMQLVIIADAARRASADKITAIVPYLAYARKDRKEKPRVPISGARVVRMIENGGVDALLTIDVHSEQLQGAFNGPWDNVYGSYALIPEIRKVNIPDLVVVSPDKSGVTRAQAFRAELGAKGIAMIYKERDYNTYGTTRALGMLGNVEGMHTLIVDDVLATGGTVVDAVKLLKEQGARTVRLAVTHGLFSGTALERIEQSELVEIFITDTIAPREEVANHPKIKVVSVANMLAEAIKRIRTGQSISEVLIPTRLTQQLPQLTI